MNSQKFFAARNSRWSASMVCVAAAMVAAMISCTGSNPRVEAMENGVYVKKTVSAYAISGARDGSTTHASASLTFDDGDRLHIDLNVTYNPTPELASGHWTREGKVNEEGDVHAESIKFLGGQGATPSVGGRFVLESLGQPRMRVVLPARELQRPLR
jgi:hypothetical protein